MSSHSYQPTFRQGFTPGSLEAIRAVQMEHRYEGKASAEQQAAGKQPGHGFSSREGAAVVEETADTWHVLHVHGGLRICCMEYDVVYKTLNCCFCACSDLSCREAQPCVSAPLPCWEGLLLTAQQQSGLAAATLCSKVCLFITQWHAALPLHPLEAKEHRQQQLGSMCGWGQDTPKDQTPTPT
jgi:hypothetical protein